MRVTPSASSKTSALKVRNALKNCKAVIITSRPPQSHYRTENKKICSYMPNISRCFLFERLTSFVVFCYNNVMKGVFVKTYVKSFNLFKNMGRLSL